MEHRAKANKRKVDIKKPDMMDITEAFQFDNPGSW
jgi:hypothetical protein